MSLEEKFNELCQIVQTLPKDGDFQLSNDEKLKFYAYFKQVKEGACNTAQPYFYQIVERSKWNAWDAVKSLSKEQAMQAYLDEMKQAVSKAPAGNEHVAKINAVLAK